MKTQSRKNKGRIFQQHVAKKVREFFNLPEDDVVSRPLGSGGEDLMLSNRARKILPVSWECKAWKEFPNLAALRQAESNARGYTPVVCWKPHRARYEDSIVYLKLNDFLELIKRKIDEKEN